LGAKIVNFDEATFRLVPVKQRIWTAKGSKPALPFWFSNTKANIFGALVDGKGMYCEWFDKLNANYFIQFIKNFVKTLDKNQKYVFIFDNAPAHKAKKSKEFLASLGENIFVEYLPPYSPQLNRIEICWRIIRHQVTSSNFFKTIDVLKRGVEQFLDGYNFMLKSPNYLSR
jgi:transposase